MEMMELIRKLNHYRDLYYNKNASAISDREYDAMFDRLAELEKRLGIVYANSPTQTVGYSAVSSLKKIRHNHPLLSLGKTTDISAFVEYFDRHRAVIMAKLDGLTCSLTYRNGKLVSAESRGNGEIGEDITNNARVFVNLPIYIPYKGEVIVDGECIIDQETFDTINSMEDTQYKNQRNLVSGTVRQLDSAVVARRGVRFVAWKLYSAITEDGKRSSRCNKVLTGFDFLERIGFEVVPYINANNENWTHKNLIVSIWREAIEGIQSRCAKLGYPIDGVVAAFDDIAYGESLGSTGHHPKHSLAYKFYQQDNETRLVDIEWNTSRTGMINPVAILEPIEIDGTTVTRATLNNVSIIRELELGIGDTVTVIKANQIIPQITGNLTRSNTCVIPDRCPYCGAETMIKSDNSRQALYCTNADCGAVKHDRLLNFTSREGMNIVGLSEERLKALIDAGFITDYSSVYRLKDHESMIAAMPGFGETSVKKLLAAIEDSRKCRLQNFIVAIGIPNIGKSSAKSISTYIINESGELPPIERLLECAEKNLDWSVMEGFGESTSVQINDYLCNHADEIRALAKKIEIESEDGQSGSMLFAGKTFCITGKLQLFNNRDELVDAIERNGGKVVSGVTAKTAYLLTNDVDSGSSKNEKARRFGTTIISEAEFIDLI